MSQVKWLNIAEKKKSPHVLFFKKIILFDFLMTEAALLFPFKITSLASGFLSAICLA